MGPARVIGIGLYFARKKWRGKQNKEESDEGGGEQHELPDEPNLRSDGAKGTRYRTNPRGNNGLNRGDLPSPRPETLDDDGELDKEDSYGLSQGETSNTNPHTPGMNGEGRPPFDE
jgi:hypothetical protein